MDLFARFPTFRVKISEEDQTLIPAQAKEAHPEFAPEFAILEEKLVGFFREFDRKARINQNAYRRMYVILIFGSAIATIIGICQLVIDNDWIGIIGALLVALLGVVTLISRFNNYQERFLNARHGAELLRTEYFLYLGHLGPYREEKHRVARLINRVAEIRTGGEQHGNA